MNERAALLVVDLQPDFMPGGALAVAGGDEIVAPIARVLPKFSTVVATQDWHPPGHVSFGVWPEHCVQGTPGAALHAGLPDRGLTLVLRKGARRDVDSYSAFRENVGPDGQRTSTGLADLLRARGIDSIYVCGLARDVCVAATAIDGVAAGFAVTVLDDLTRAVDPNASTDARLREAGVQIATSAVLS